MKRLNVNSSIESFLVMILMVVFAVSTMFIIVEGKSAFERVTENKIEDENARIAFSYINKRIKQDDVSFIKDYINHVQEKSEDIEFPKELQEDVVKFIEMLKKDEKDYLVEVGPRLVIGFMRLCKGLAVMENRRMVEEKDLERIKSIIKDSLSLK